LLPLRVDGEIEQELASAGVDDPDLAVLDPEQDRGSGVLAADADVVKVAVVAHDDSSGLTDVVGPDAVEGVAGAGTGGGFGPGGVGGRWGGAAQ
jgi:hypothetical protein